MKAYIKTALRRRLCLEYSYFDKIPPGPVKIYAQNCLQAPAE